MNEEAGAPPSDPAAPVTPVKKPDATWLGALSVLRRNPRETLLPVAVTQLPFAILTAAAFFYLFNDRYPTAEYDSFSWLNNAPNGIRLTMVLLGGAQSLFALVGAAATMVAVSAVLQGKPIGLANSLDPAFTRMGGLLLIGALFYAMLIATVFGIIVLLYFLIRFGLALQVYIIEGTSVSESFRLSWGLLRGRMLAFTGVLFTAIPFAVVLLFVANFALGIVVAPFATNAGRTTEVAIQSAAIFLVGLTLVPIAAYVAVSTTIFYRNAKERSRA